MIHNYEFSEFDISGMLKLFKLALRSAVVPDFYVEVQQLSTNINFIKKEERSKVITTSCLVNSVKGIFI